MAATKEVGDGTIVGCCEPCNAWTRPVFAGDSITAAIKQLTNAHANTERVLKV